MTIDVDWQMAAAMLLLGYLLGSIPFGVILTRLFGAGDLRSIGSGNIGATNVLRTGRKGLAAATLLLDLLKGALAIWIAREIAPDATLWAGVGALLGHVFPVWLRFRGGKGVATLMGVVLAFDWRLGAVYAALWLGLLALLRISSLAGLAAAAAMPVAALLFGLDRLAVPLVGMAAVVFWKHRDNISRLIAGTEPRVGRSGRDSDAS